MPPSVPTSVFDRTNFAIMGAGFSFAFILKYGLILLTRKLRGNDLAAFLIFLCWLFYMVVQIVDAWVNSFSYPPNQLQSAKLLVLTFLPSTFLLQTKRVCCAIPNFQWVNAFVSLLSSIVLCAVLHLSFVRCSALAGFPNQWKLIFDRIGIGMVACVFAVRVVRVGFIFYTTSQTDPATNAYLSGNSTMMQITTLMPSLFTRVILDTWSLINLYRCRIKFIKQAGSHPAAFWIITWSLMVEFVFSILAIIVGMQEALTYTGDKLSFMDWLLYSWCLGSWVEQRPLYAQIFGAQMTGTGNLSDTQSGTQFSNNRVGSRNAKKGENVNVSEARSENKAGAEENV
ncbi:hypothetical protein HDU97_006296 [Phlyctochytrium planicorne]|nr:hypothetical protein HDU97_006296 [Phlyctochytrium planicorne]